MENIKKIQARLVTVFSDTIPTSNAFFTFAKASFINIAGNLLYVKKNLILSVFISLNCFVFGGAPSNVIGILKDLGIPKEEAVVMGLFNSINQALNIRSRLREKHVRTTEYIVNGMLQTKDLFH